MSVAEVTMSRDGIWLTAMLRPVGELAGRAIERFVDDLMALAQRANIVIDKQGVIQFVEEGDSAVDPNTALTMCTTLHKKEPAK